ncbi:MAG: hypothetical protein L0H19_08235, partial [Salinisphaera sp.]|nr:hypothetical protein [Salinisphaera sp.]
MNKPLSAELPVIATGKAPLLTLPRIKILVLPTLMLGAVGLATVPLWAQEPRGIQLRFGVQMGLESQSNRALEPS